MRIITGIYKGRRFDVPRSFKARPTTDFAKENIFNVLNKYVDFEDSAALDLFAGTGSISLELLSRGCREVVSVEKDRDHARFILQCLEKINATNDTLICGDVFRFLKSNKKLFNVVFADPPYTLNNIVDLPDLILTGKTLAPDGLFVLEHGKHNNFETHPMFIEHRSYGSVNFSLFR